MDNVSNLHFDFPTWDQIYTMLLAQAEKIQETHFYPDIILGVSRGGLVPARIHSDLLENPNLASIRIECYVGTKEAERAPTLSQEVSVSIDGKKLLLVDDICDTGRSLQLAKQHLVKKDAKQILTATLYRKPWSTLNPDYCERETEHWVVFPWDLKETIREVFESNSDLSEPQLSAKLVQDGFPKLHVERVLKSMTKGTL